MKISVYIDKILCSIETDYKPANEKELFEKLYSEAINQLTKRLNVIYNMQMLSLQQNKQYMLKNEPQKPQTIQN